MFIENRFPVNIRFKFMYYNFPKTTARCRKLIRKGQNLAYGAE